MYFVGLDLAWGQRKPTGVAVVDDGGRLVAQGTHLELLETSSTYREIADSQLALDGPA